METEPSLRRDVLPLITASVYRLASEAQTLGQLAAEAGTLGVKKLTENAAHLLAELTTDEHRGEAGEGEDADLYRALSPAEELLVASGADPRDLRRIQLEVRLERSAPLKDREALQIIAALTTQYAEEEVNLQLERAQLDLSEPVLTATFALTRDDLTRTMLQEPSRGELHLPGLGKHSITRTS